MHRYEYPLYILVQYIIIYNKYSIYLKSHCELAPLSSRHVLSTILYIWFNSRAHPWSRLSPPPPLPFNTVHTPLALTAYYPSTPVTRPPSCLPWVWWKWTNDLLAFVSAPESILHRAARINFKKPEVTSCHTCSKPSRIKFRVFPVGIWVW